MKKINLSFYTKNQCPLCEKAKKIVMELSNEFPLEIVEYDIYKDDYLLEKYQIMIPVLAMDGEEIGFGIIHKEELRKRLIEKSGISSVDS